MGYTQSEKRHLSQIKFELQNVSLETSSLTSSFKDFNDRLRKRADRLEKNERDNSDVLADVVAFENIIKDLKATEDKLNEIIKEI